MSADTEQLETKPWANDAWRLAHPIRVTSRADIAGILKDMRVARGLTCEEFDAHAGWSDRYVTKMENSAGRTTGGRRQGVHITPPTSDDPHAGRAYSGEIKTSFMSEVWFESHEVALVLMPRWQADEIGAQPAPKRAADA